MAAEEGMFHSFVGGVGSSSADPGPPEAGIWQGGDSPGSSSLLAAPRRSSSFSRLAEFYGVGEREEEHDYVGPAMNAVTERNRRFLEGSHLERIVEVGAESPRIVEVGAESSFSRGLPSGTHRGGMLSNIVYEDHVLSLYMGSQCC